MANTNDPRSAYLGHPTKGIPSLFAILFAISGIVHIYQNSTYKCWRFLWILPCDAIVFVAGFICLEYNAFHPTAFAPSQGLLYSAVVILLAGLCISLMYLIATYFRGTGRCHNSALYVLVMLILSSIISLTAQGTANFFNPGGKAQNVHDNLHVLQAGVVMLLALNIAFIGVLAGFHQKCLKAGTFRGEDRKRLRDSIYGFYAAAMLLLVRNVFRTVQIFMGPDAAIWRYEVFFWVFDVLPSFVCMAMLNLLHPLR